MTVKSLFAAAGDYPKTDLMPLLYGVGLTRPTEAITHAFEGVTFGGISMTFQMG